MAIQLSSDLNKADKVQISTNYEKPKFVVFSIAHARPDTISHVVREITRMKKGISIILESNWECAKGMFAEYIRYCIYVND